jgi:hypothetical protein
MIEVRAMNKILKNCAFGAIHRLAVAATLGTLLLAGCGEQSGPVTSKSTKYEAADGNSADNGDAAASPTT